MSLVFLRRYYVDTSNIFLNLAGIIPLEPACSVRGVPTKPPIFMTSLTKIMGSWGIFAGNRCPILCPETCMVMSVFFETKKTATGSVNVNQYTIIYLKTSSCHTKGFQGTEMSANLVNRKTEGMLLKTWEVNSFLWRIEKYWETLWIHMISTLDSFGHEKTCCRDILLVLTECSKHCMPSAQVIQEDLLYGTWSTIKKSPTVYCSTWTCSSISISPAQTYWRYFPGVKL